MATLRLFSAITSRLVSIYLLPFLIKMAAAFHGYMIMCATFIYPMVTYYVEAVSHSMPLRLHSEPRQSSWRIHRIVEFKHIVQLNLDILSSY
eukprot:scaffold95674_cov21-Prasinocladus_malaysianus.AAC.1